MKDAADIDVTQQLLGGAKSRKAFLATLSTAAAAGTVLAAGGPTVFAAGKRMAQHAASFPKSDAEILNFALTLEHLEARFYEEADSRFGQYDTYLRRLIRDIRSDEETHVSALTSVLKGAGYKPVRGQSRYNFGGAFQSRHTLLKFSSELETTGVHAYLGQAGNIKTPALLLTAASILTVEARHTGAILGLMAKNPSLGAFDKGYTKQQILDIVKPILG